MEVQELSCLMVYHEIPSILESVCSLPLSRLSNCTEMPPNSFTVGHATLLADSEDATLVDHCSRLISYTIKDISHLSVYAEQTV